MRLGMGNKDYLSESSFRKNYFVINGLCVGEQHGKSIRYVGRKRIYK